MCKNVIALLKPYIYYNDYSLYIYIYIYIYIYTIELCDILYILYTVLLV